MFNKTQTIILWWKNITAERTVSGAGSNFNFILVITPSVPSEPMKRSIASIFSLQKYPAVFFVVSILVAGIIKSIFVPLFVWIDNLNLSAKTLPLSNTSKSPVGKTISIPRTKSRVGPYLKVFEPEALVAIVPPRKQFSSVGSGG